MGRWGLGFAWSGALIWTGDWTTQTTWPVSLLPFSFRDVANIVWNCSQWIQSDITGSHWLLWGHMTSNNKTVSCQNLWAGNIAKSMTSELRVTVHCYLRMLTDNHHYIAARFHEFPALYCNNSLKDRSLRKQLFLFASGPVTKYLLLIFVYSLFNSYWVMIVHFRVRYDRWIKEVKMHFWQP